MVNTTDFTKRLIQVMEYYNINASALADELGIQRSSISHLLSERNKPSLDFVLKLNEKYPEVDILWLTLGKGDFPPVENESLNTKNTDNEISNSKKLDLFSYKLEENNPEIPNAKKDLEHSEIIKKEIQKIIFFYTDNSFEIFENK